MRIPLNVQLKFENYEAHELVSAKIQNQKTPLLNTESLFGKKITWLACLPFHFIKAIYDSALSKLYHIIDPWVFEMQIGGGCGSAMDEIAKEEWTQFISNGSYQQNPLLNRTSLTIKTLEGSEINGMSFHTADSAPTMVLCFAKDNTYATSSGMMTSFCKRVQATGMNLLLIDLPGHGYGKGKATEKSCVDAIRSAYCYVKENWRVEDHKMFFLGQCLSSGLVGSIVEEHPDINPIFVDPYSNLSDIPSSIPILGPFFTLLFKMLYKINTVNAINVLKGNACVIYSQNDKVLDPSHLSKIMQTSRKALQTPCYIPTNAPHAEKGWMCDQQVMNRFEAYLRNTLAKSEERHKIQTITQLDTYISSYSSTLSIAERYSLAKDAQTLLKQFCKTPKEFSQAIGNEYNPYRTFVDPSSLISNCLIGTPLSDTYREELLKEFFKEQYKSAIETNNTKLAKDWVDFVSTSWNELGKSIKEDWVNRQKP